MGKWMRPLTAEKFDAVGAFRDGLAAVVLRGKYGLIRDDGRWAIEPRFDQAYPIGRDRAIVTLDGRSGVYDVANDTWSRRRTFDDICASQHGLVGVMLDGKAGVIDASGAWLIAPKYDATALGYGPLASAGTGLIPVRGRGNWGFVDFAGNEVIAPRFDEVSYFERGMSWSRTGAEWCAIDRRGERISTLSCQNTKPINVRTPSTFSCRISRW